MCVCVCLCVCVYVCVYVCVCVCANMRAVEKDIHREIERTRPDMVDRLPKIPKFVGGRVDVMLGRKYIKDFPLEVVRLKSGLILYNSMFSSVDGSSGVVLGPHPEFTKIERSSFYTAGRTSFYTEATLSCLNYMEEHMACPLLGEKKSLVDSDMLQSFPMDATKYQGVHN